jgi:uncharacterized membrane protein
MRGSLPPGAHLLEQGSCLVNLLHVSVHPALALLGWLFLAPALVLALHASCRDFLKLDIVKDAWLGGAVFVALLWTLEIKVGVGPRFGMLGAGLYALVFGRARGVLGLMLALLMHTAFNHGSWLNLGLNGVFFGVLPTMIASALQQRIEKTLPHNLFVFMIGNGMFVTFIATAATSLALMATALATGASAPVADLDEYLGAALLLAWSESIVSGMLLSALVVFLPIVVLTYRADIYLARR